MMRETHLALWAMLILTPSSCTTSDEGGVQGDESLIIPEHPRVTLELDDGSAGTGSALFYEVEVGADASCVASIVLASGDRYGARLPSTLAFLDRSPGTGSSAIVLTGYDSVYWNPVDPDAPFEEMTDSWSGAFVLSEWSPDRIGITLHDGQHCPIGGSTAECVAASGVLQIEGPRIPDTAVPYGASFTDLATGQVLCDFDW